MCSVANFVYEIPAEKIANIQNNNSLNDKEKENKIAEAKLNWEKSIRDMLYLDMPTTGDASETALIKFYQPIADIQQMRAQFPCTMDSENQ